MDGRSNITGNAREWRRLRAPELSGRGWHQCDIAEALGARDETISRWLARAREGGPEALFARPSPGRPPRLPPEQRRLIPESLWRGAQAYGFRGQVWTRARIARVIGEELGVHYHKSHVGKLLKASRWTPRMPIRRAAPRDERAIASWREELWPELLCRACEERRALVFEDEAGLYLLPGPVRTYAPAGRTPVLREKATRDHLPVMGGMTPEGKVCTLVRRRPLNGLHVIEFLIHLRRAAGDRPLVVWDGSPIHRRAAVREHPDGSRAAVRVEQLPGCAPDLNPWDEGGWNRLKNAELRDVVCRDLEELHEQFHLAVARLRQRPRLVRAFFAQAGLPLGGTRSSLCGGQ